MASGLNPLHTRVVGQVVVSVNAIRKFSQFLGIERKLGVMFEFKFFQPSTSTKVCAKNLSDLILGGVIIESISICFRRLIWILLELWGGQPPGRFYVVFKFFFLQTKNKTRSHLLTPARWWGRVGFVVVVVIVIVTLHWYNRNSWNIKLIKL